MKIGPRHKHDLRRKSECGARHLDVVALAMARFLEDEIGDQAARELRETAKRRRGRQVTR